MPRKSKPAVAPVVEPDRGYSSLNGIKVPITGLRNRLLGLKMDGIDEYPLGDLLLLIKEVVKDAPNND